MVCVFVCGYVPCVNGVSVGFGPYLDLVDIYREIRVTHDDCAGKEICR